MKPHQLQRIRSAETETGVPLVKVSKTGELTEAEVQELVSYLRSL